MVWGCFATSGPGWLAIIDGTMNSALYQKILKENVRSSVCDLKLKRTWVMHRAGFTHRHSRHVPICSLVQGGPNIYFVILWAIYESKRTKTPEDIEKINITNNRVKNDKLFPCFPPFLCTEITLSFSSSLSQTRIHTDTRNSCGDVDKNLSLLPREFISKIVSQLKSYMTFLRSEVLEAVQLKDSLLVETLNTAERRTDAGIHTLLISLSLALSLSL